MLEKRGLSSARVVSKRVEVSDKSEVLGEWAVAWLCGVDGSDGCGEREGLNELSVAESSRICSKSLLSASSIP